jgi:exopolyphosphatase / guanosine-5'-triphosphate,3'-diphosphate pyrophosphatase
MSYPEIAAVDLGSNSFRLQLARVVGDDLLFHDSLRESVRLGAGLNEKRELSNDAQLRAINCLKKFGERLRGMPTGAVRAVATNTFRIAKNSASFIKEAESALGFPIEVIAGIEEARMIFIGVSHSLPMSQQKRLVIDIGGGSTEFIIGKGYEPSKLESLYMGCVSYSLRFFPDGKLSKEAFDSAELAAASEIEQIADQFNSSHWQEGIGSSGTAKALGEILRLNQFSDGDITKEGLEKLKKSLIKIGHTKSINLEGLSEDRAQVIPGGLSIMLSAFNALGISVLKPSSSALREGVLYELLGRLHQKDSRDTTVETFTRRYLVDQTRSKRIEGLSLNLFNQIQNHLSIPEEMAKHYLIWASQLHEIGISIAHAGYHRHSAYIVEHADMPGFSKAEQSTLALIIRAHRRSLTKVVSQDNRPDILSLIVIFRIAVLLGKNRSANQLPKIELNVLNTHQFRLKIQTTWLEKNPLTQTQLQEEIALLKSAGILLKIK